MPFHEFQKLLGAAIQDAEEEIFLLFSQSIPSQNLGFVDSKATSLALTVAGRDITITQSPGLLSSNRQQGTTGAVVWKITPAFADWIAWDKNVLFTCGLMHSKSTVVELGCGISGILPLVLAPKVGKYIATDQEYVFKLLRQNLSDNAFQESNMKNKSTGKKMAKKGISSKSEKGVEILTLDWETTSASSISSFVPSGSSIDVVIACDCIYNEALIKAFVNTCAEICRLRQTLDDNAKATVCVIAQQLRSDLVFEAWLSKFSELFTVWRMPDGLLSDRLKEGNGLVVHAGVLRKRTQIS